MPEALPTACKCGAGPQEEQDFLTGATMLECVECSRYVGAGTKAEAVRMWNAAMRADEQS